MLDEKYITQGYRYFLGRDPEPNHGWKFRDFAHLCAALHQSAEFKAKPRSKKNSLTWPLNQVFVLPQYKMIYCPIGKNACTFLKRQFARLSGHEHLDFLLNDIHFLASLTNAGLELSDMPEQDVEDLLADPELMSVALLRDPAERLLSAYLEKLVYNRMAVGNQAHTHRVTAAAQGTGKPDFERGISFRQFADAVVASDPNTTDTHWRPQSKYLAGINYTHLYKFDQLETLLQDLEAHSGKTLPRKPVNVTQREKGSFEKDAADWLPAQISDGPCPSNSSFLNEDLMEKIRLYYAEDYALLDR